LLGKWFSTSKREYQEPLVQHSSVTSQKTGIIDLQNAHFSKIFRVGKMLKIVNELLDVKNTHTHTNTHTRAHT